MGIKNTEFNLKMTDWQDAKRRKAIMTLMILLLGTIFVKFKIWKQ